MTEGETGTKDRILDTAERLFAELGFAATSLRAITSEAEVNLAAVNYHFGSKEELFHYVFSRRIEPINRERLEMLAVFERDAVDGLPDLEKILEAFLAPALRLCRDTSPGGRNFLRLMGRIYTEPGDYWKPIFSQFEPIRARFETVLKRALPDLPPLELFWREHFLVGVMCHTIADTHRLEVISGGLCDPNDVDGMLRRLIGFLAAGLRSPAPRPLEDSGGVNR
jgi:AcrR family transcriptional regulator